MNSFRIRRFPCKPLSRCTTRLSGTSPVISPRFATTSVNIVRPVCENGTILWKSRECSSLRRFGVSALGFFRHRIEHSRSTSDRCTWESSKRNVNIQPEQTVFAANSDIRRAASFPITRHPGKPGQMSSLVVKPFRTTAARCVTHARQRSLADDIAVPYSGPGALLSELSVPNSAFFFRPRPHTNIVAVLRTSGPDGSRC